MSKKAVMVLFAGALIAILSASGFRFLSAQSLTEDRHDIIVEVLKSNTFSQRIKSIYSAGTKSSACEGIFDEVKRGDCLLLKSLRLLDEGEFDLAFKNLKESAQLSNAYAKVKLGEIFLLSEQPGSLDTAIVWYKEAVHSGNPIAEYMLARLGLIFPDRIEEADDYFLQLVNRSADEGIIPAIKFLGDISRDGLFGASKDKIRAFDFYLTAANEGYAPAQYEIAILCIEKGLIEDAVTWLDKAASSGYAPAHYRLGLYYWDQPEVFEDASADAVFHLRAAYEAGIVESSLTLGTAYLMGRGVERDYDQALYLFNKALGSSEGFAESFLGQMHSRGLGVEKDMNLACSYFRDSAFAGNPHGQYGHGICLQANGEAERSLKWIRKAAEQGLDRAVLYIAEGK